MQLRVILATDLARSVQPRMRPEAIAGCRYTDDHVELLAMIREPALKHQRLHQASGAGPAEDGKHCAAAGDGNAGS